jgi:hypothetical protein
VENRLAQRRTCRWRSRAPDGYRTLFMAALPQNRDIPRHDKVSYDPVKDFSPISQCRAATLSL